MRVVVDHNLCEANARCIQAAPEVFELRDDDKSYVRLERVGEELKASVKKAAQLCPRAAITIIED